MASNDTPELPEEIVTQICRGLVIQDIVHLSEVIFIIIWIIYYNFSSHFNLQYSIRSIKS